MMKKKMSVKVIASLLLVFFCFLSFGYTETIVLKSGKTVEGEIIEETDEYIKLDFNGIPLIYHKEEIDSITRVLKPEAEAHYSKGITLFDEGRLLEAVQEFKESIKVNSHFSLPFFNLGSTYSELGQYSEAISAFEKAIELYPDFAEAYSNLGGAYYHLGRFYNATGLLQRAIELDPNYAEAYTRLGFVYLAMARYDDAITLSKESIAINPNLPEGYGSLGLAYKAIGQKEEARKNLIKSRDLFRQNGQEQQAQKVEKALESWYEPEVTYYPNGQVKSLKTYDPSGKLHSETLYKDGKTEGIWKVYYASGKLLSEITYKNSKEGEIAKYYFENGKLEAEVPTKGDKTDGIVKHYYENGVLASEVSYRDGELEWIKKYDENGNLTEEQFE